MPTSGEYFYSDKSERIREARRQVRAKFPALMEDSSGWHRAVANRMKRRSNP